MCPLPLSPPWPLLVVEGEAAAGKGAGGAQWREDNVHVCNTPPPWQCWGGPAAKQGLLQAAAPSCQHLRLPGSFSPSKRVPRVGAGHTGLCFVSPSRAGSTGSSIWKTSPRQPLLCFTHLLLTPQPALGRELALNPRSNCSCLLLEEQPSRGPSACPRDADISPPDLSS